MHFGEFFMTKMQSDDLRRRGGYPADPQRSREKLFFFFSFHAWTRRSEAAASYLNSFATWQKGESPLKWCGRQLSSVLLSILYGYPWPPGASTSGFTFLFWYIYNFFLQPGANSLNVQKTSALDNVKSQKVPEKEKRGGRGDLSVFLKQP